MKEAVIGVDIGGTKIAAHISDGTLWSVNETTIATPQNAEALFSALIDLCRDLRASAQEINIKALGVGSAGQIDPVNGVVLDANENIPGWKGVNISKVVGAALDLPVYVENDVNVMALAESTLGVAHAYRHVLCMTVGTGIGGAIILDGQLWQGAHFSAGEIGYIYGADGQNIEQLYAGPAIERQYAAMYGQQMRLRKIAQYAQADDTQAAAVIQQAAHELGLRVAPVLALLDPEVLVVGGGVPEIGDLWWGAFVAALRAAKLGSVREMPILKAQFGNRAGMIGAAVLAAQKLDLR